MTFSRMRKVVWGSVILLSAGVAVYAFNPQPDPPGHYYGLMTLPGNQTIAVHVSNISRPALELTDVTLGHTSPPPVCNAELQLIDPDGRVVASDSQRIMPAESFSLNFTVPEFPPDPCRTDRSGEAACMQLRAQVTFKSGGSHCVSSVEVGSPFGGGGGDSGSIRASGGFEHPAMIVGFNPQPDPPVPAPKLR